MPVLVDSHAHLDLAAFDGDRAEVMQRARAAGVTRQIVPAIEAATWPKVRDLCAAEDGLFPAYGLHPMFVERHRPEHLEALREWIARERPVAVGECGLDWRDGSPARDVQQRYFDAQLEIARDAGLPVIVHAVHAVEDVIAAIRRVGDLRGVVHSYGGSEDQAAQLWKLGFHVGLGGPLTWDRANRLQRVVRAIPLEQLLLETDAPDQPDSAHRGQRNEPARLVVVLDAVARLRGEDRDVIAAQTTANAERLFGLPCELH